MTLTTDKVYDGMDIINLLVRNMDESTSYHNNQEWSITIDDVRMLILSPERSEADDFLDMLLHGSDCSSVPASPLWSPCTTDSGINEDLLSDPTDTAISTDFSAFDADAFAQPQSVRNQPTTNEKEMDVAIDLGCESVGLPEDCGSKYYSSNQNPLLPSSHTLTVKDLLLSNLGHQAQQIPKHSLQELVFSEDEKKLLAKEGVNLPSKLPLSKFEERVLKKIRRKIRNKRSAQESRKKRREYVDSLEGRMSACSAHNLELQRKIQQLEERNNTLLEQLSQLQARLPIGSSKTTRKGTYILVLLLSFSLLISSNLQPDAYSQLSQPEYTETKVLSRSLQWVADAEDVPSPPLLPSAFRGFEARHSLTEELWPSTDLPRAEFHSSHLKDHRHKDTH
ncbi:cyclic AMP-responsive element-binding protein 3-like protein 3-A [Pholidichthys leucotaenia]